MKASNVSSFFHMSTSRGNRIKKKAMLDVSDDSEDIDTNDVPQ